MKCSTCKDHRNTHENTRLMPDTWIVFSHTEPVYNTYLSTNLGYLRRGSSWQHGGSTCSNPSSCLFAATAGRIFAFDPLRHFLPILFSSKLEGPSFLPSFFVPFRFSRQLLRQQSGRDATLQVRCSDFTLVSRMYVR